MDFLNKISNMASETYKKTSKKTGELAQEAKIRMKMNEDKGKIKDLYGEIGKIVYQKHIDHAPISIEDDLGEYCTQIDDLAAGIDKALDQILTLRGKRICEKCHEEIDIKVNFCPSCGAEQPPIPVEEVVEEEEVPENEEEKTEETEDTTEDDSEKKD